MTGHAICTRWSHKQLVQKIYGEGLWWSKGEVNKKPWLAVLLQFIHTFSRMYLPQARKFGNWASVCFRFLEFCLLMSFCTHRYHHQITSSHGVSCMFDKFYWYLKLIFWCEQNYTERWFLIDWFCFSQSEYGSRPPAVLSSPPLLCCDAPKQKTVLLSKLKLLDQAALKWASVFRSHHS